MAPIRTDLHYPVGEFLLHIRPLDGWRPSFDEMAVPRLRTLGLGVLLFVPVLLANWFAISGQATRSRLLATETKLSALVNNLPGAAFVYSRPAGIDRPGPEDRVTFLNQDSCQDLWGVDARVAESDALALWNRAVNKERSEAFTRHLVTATREMRPWTHTWQIRTPEGVEKWLTGRGHPVPMENGMVSWFCMVFDVSEEVAREAELEKQRDLAFKAQKNESIGHLTGGMAHDFNNLLAVIMGSLELLAEEENSPGTSRLIRSALDATERGADLTRNMLAFARRARLAPERLDLNDVLRDANSWMGRTLPDSITVETSLLSGLWKVSADRGATESALLNLILNARDAMNGHGRLTLTTKNIHIDADSAGEGGEELAPGRYVQLAVTDTGHGIPKDLRDKIFEPFFTTKETGRGTGLGLSMVVGFMRQSGGTVRIRSSQEEGTTIALFFPAATDQKNLLKSSRPDTSLQGGTGAKILLTEDEPGVRDVLEAILERAGHIVTQARSGDHALSIFHSDPGFDLLVTDIVMPGTLQGTDLVKALREIRTELPVIFMSGYTDQATAHGMSLCGEDIHLMKPVHRSKLLEAVITVLDRTAKDADG
ncbi:response regulator [Tropicimonas sp. TH_r6]|uniref:ATP-binding protein n=1 Tax=Tropicimonas sp. TH_r6 TaxID=3082085 RepID=UPI0029545F16|nr:ATP-binding protein [Tropicimonas sp. TH_r6]MDV7144353.1 response regulator [Tropicimonas sp. TH_r6]